MNAFSIFLCAAMAASALAFSPAGTSVVRPRFALNSVATEQTFSIKQVDAPDFYWKFRLDRLSKMFSDRAPFSASTYEGVSGYKDLYEAYYLDLTLQGHMENFNWIAEKEISTSEWLTIFNSIAAWSAGVAGGDATDASKLPSNDFDLLQQFYPQLSFKELESPFSADEVPKNFPYRNMKEMFEAASAGKFEAPGFTGAKGNLDASEAKKELAALKESSMAKLDKVFAEAMAYAENPFIDDQAKTHYKALREKLADFPSDEAGWKKLRAVMEKEVDEMARLASKTSDEHHGHDEGGMSPAEEFEAKYGRNLDEMQERMNEYKSDPTGFLEASIIEKYGKQGLDVWKKSQEFSEKMSVMSDADKDATEKAFSDFLKQA